MSKAERILGIIEAEIAAKRLILPTLPDIATRISDLARRSDIDAETLAAEIAKDPAFSARLLRTANSAAMQGLGRRVESLPKAITRLGFDLTCALVKRFAIEQVFQAKAPILRMVMHRTWKRSLEVAALSQVLAMHRTALKKETALLAGLIHLVGVLPVVRVVDQKVELSMPDRELDQVIASLHARIARRVLQEWNFPPELLNVPAQAFDFGRRHDGPADYADVVSVAMLQSAENEDVLLRGVDRSTVPAFARLGIAAETAVLDMPDVQESFEHNAELLAA